MMEAMTAHATIENTDATIRRLRKALEDISEKWTGHHQVYGDEFQSGYETALEELGNIALVALNVATIKN